MDPPKAATGAVSLPWVSLFPRKDNVPNPDSIMVNFERF
jgi:hypothetical protein